MPEEKAPIHDIFLPTLFIIISLVGGWFGTQLASHLPRDTLIAFDNSVRYCIYFFSGMSYSHLNK